MSKVRKIDRSNEKWKALGYILINLDKYLVNIDKIYEKIVYNEVDIIILKP